MPNSIHNSARHIYYFIFIGIYCTFLLGCAGISSETKVQPEPIPSPSEIASEPASDATDGKESGLIAAIPEPKITESLPPPSPTKTTTNNPAIKASTEANNVDNIIQANLAEQEAVESIENLKIEDLILADFADRKITEPAPLLSPADIIVSYESEQKKSNSASDYTLRPGDVIEISVLGEDLAREVIVPPDGTISFFLVGQLHVADMSIEEMRLELEERLAETLPSASVIVHGKNLMGDAAQILGAVNLPGYKNIQPGDQLSDLLAKAGGLWSFPSESNENIPLEAADLANAFWARKDKIKDIDLVALLDTGENEQDHELQAGDLLYIPSKGRNGIAVIGQLNNPTIIDFQQNITIFDAISLAGGIKQSRFGNDVFLLRGSLKNPEIKRLSYQNILIGFNMDIKLIGGDILFVPSNFINDLAQLPIILLPQLDAILRSEE